MVDIVQTNYPNISSIRCIVHENLENPMMLTWQHRFYMREHIDEYDWFLYAENDMFLPVANFNDYKRKFVGLSVLNAVPGFIRIEQKGNELFCSDVVVTNRIRHRNLATVNGERFIKLNAPYHALWILPQAFLKSRIMDDLFVTLKSNYFDTAYIMELASSYPMWQLGMTPLVEIAPNMKINPLCYCYHINNVRVGENTLFGKLRINDAVQILR